MCGKDKYGNIEKGNLQKITATHSNHMFHIKMEIDQETFLHFITKNTVGMLVDIFITGNPLISRMRHPKMSARQKVRKNKDTGLSVSTPVFTLSLEATREDWDAFIEIPMDKPRNIYFTIVHSEDDAERLYHYVIKEGLPTKDPESEREDLRSNRKRTMEDCPPTQQAVLMCKRKDFQFFVTGNESESQTKKAICEQCGIASRSELKSNPDAHVKWLSIMHEFSRYRAGTQLT